MQRQDNPALRLLDELGIEYAYAEHPAVYTIPEMEALGLDREGEIAKNLFLRDAKKQRYFLLVISQRKSADLKALSLLLGAKGLTFASEDELTKHLGLTKGAVSPLGIVNDHEHRVELVLDEEVLALERIGVHPLVNTASVWLSPGDLTDFAEICGSKWMSISL